MDTYISEQSNSIKKLLNTWRFRPFTPFGKITVIKSLTLSKITHLALKPLIIDIFDSKIADTLNKIILDFLWDKKPAKINLKAAMLLQSLGGLFLLALAHFGNP